MWVDGAYGAPLPKKLKREVLRTHNGVCHWCKKPGADQVDHVVNRKAGGTDHPSNLRPIHKYPCHRDKTQHEAQEAKRKRRYRDGPSHPGKVQ